LGLRPEIRLRSSFSTAARAAPLAELALRAVAVQERPGRAPLPPNDDRFDGGTALTERRLQLDPGHSELAAVDDDPDAAVAPWTRARTEAPKAEEQAVSAATRSCG